MITFYKRFSTYLLEHHPLLWHTKFIQLLAVGLLFWLVSYFCGYGLTDMVLLREQYILRFYENSYFVLFHVIFVIIVLFLWALYFFKNNALKSFYPLKRGYYTKFFFQLAIGFLVLVSAAIPFTKGAQHKTAHLLPAEEFENDIANYQVVRPFLLLSYDNFSLEERIYPKPFPLKRSKYDYGTGTWSDLPRLDSLVYGDEKSLPRYQDYLPSDSSVMTKVGGNWYIYYNMKFKYTSSDSCNSDYFLNRLYPLDAEALRMREISILNYAGFNYYGNYQDVVSSENFKEKFVQTVHDLVLKDKRAEIESKMNAFLNFCQKYGVKHGVYPELLCSYLQKKNYGGFVRLTNNYSEYTQLINSKSARYLKSIEQNDTLFVQNMEEKYRLFLNEYEIEYLMDNFASSKGKVDSDMIYFFLFFSVAFAFFFLLIEVTNMISLLITIPVGGVIAIISSLIGAFVLFDRYDADLDKRMFSLILSVLVLIYMLSLILNRARHVHAMVWNVSMNLSYLITPFFLPILYYTIRAFSKHQVNHKCYGFSMEYSMPDLEAPVILLLSVLSICIFTLFIKTWKAKAE